MTTFQKLTSSVLDFLVEHSATSSLFYSFIPVSENGQFNIYGFMRGWIQLNYLNLWKFRCEEGRN